MENGWKDYGKAAEQLKEGSNNFVVDYDKAERNAVPYNMEVSYSTFPRRPPVKKQNSICL